MDLKIKDVAELLNVSETTIRRWLEDGKIPAYRLHHQIRFSCTEVQEWVMRNRLGDIAHSSIDVVQQGHKLLEMGDSALQEIQTFDNPKSSLKESVLPKINSGGSKQFSLYRAIHKGGMLYHVPGANKEQLIQGVMKKIAGNLNIDADVISELLLDREALQSTGLNNGVAIPHTRDFLLNAHFDSVTVVFPEKPLMYDSLDGKPVDILFFLFACNDKRHLHLLAKIAHLCSSFEALQFLKDKPNKQMLLEYVKTWESAFQQPREALVE